jgi:DNA-binding transcriptional MocR family regulator
MSLTRRHQLLELAARHQVPILEDDPYTDLRYEGDSLPSLKALDHEGVVLYLSTFSKVLVPGLRLGYLVAPRAAVRGFALAKQAVDLHANSFGQFLLDRFIAHGGHDRHLAKLRRAYRLRRDAMAEALAESPSGLRWEIPKGGFYFWCRLPDTVDRSRLMSRAADKAVAFLPGWSCFAEEDEGTHVRLAFSFVDRDAVREGSRRFVEAVREADAGESSSDTSFASTPTFV